MYAIVEIAGKQYKVRENDKLVVPRLNGEVNDSVTFDRVLLVADDDDVQIGTPVLSDASVTATIVEHVKGDKVLVFRKKRRKRFKVMRGHRQPYTRIEVSGLSLDGIGKTSKKSTRASKKDVKAEVEPQKSEAAAASDVASVETTAADKKAKRGKAASETPSDEEVAAAGPDASEAGSETDETESKE